MNFLACIPKHKYRYIRPLGKVDGHCPFYLRLVNCFLYVSYCIVDVHIGVYILLQTFNAFSIKFLSPYKHWLSQETWILFVIVYIFTLLIFTLIDLCLLAHMGFERITLYIWLLDYSNNCFARIIKKYSLFVFELTTFSRHSTIFIAKICCTRYLLIIIIMLTNSFLFYFWKERRTAYHNRFFIVTSLFWCLLQPLLLL